MTDTIWTEQCNTAQAPVGESDSLARSVFVPDLKEAAGFAVMHNVHMLNNFKWRRPRISTDLLGTNSEDTTQKRTVLLGRLTGVAAKHMLSISLVESGGVFEKSIEMFGSVSSGARGISEVDENLKIKKRHQREFSESTPWFCWIFHKPQQQFSQKFFSSKCS